MVRDLNMPVAIEVGPIVREADGLALSSRNSYLNRKERTASLVLYRALMRIQEFFEHGERKSESLIATAKQEFAGEPSVRLDYLEIVNPDSLQPESPITRRVLVAVAAFVGNTRLIDNLLLEP